MYKQVGTNEMSDSNCLCKLFCTEKNFKRNIQIISDNMDMDERMQIRSIRFYLYVFHWSSLESSIFQIDENL